MSPASHLIRTNKVAFIVDLDNTLINTDGIKRRWENHFKTGFLDAYKKAKIKKGYPDIQELAKLLSVDPNYFYKTPFKKYLFKDSLKAISTFKKVGKVVVLTLGDKNYQSLKIKNSGIEKMVGPSGVVISQNKKSDIKKLIDSLLKDDFTEVVMIDDISSNLEFASKIYPKTVNVWFRFGKYKNKYPLIKNIVALEAYNLTAVADYLSRFITVIHPPKSNLKLSILAGMDNNCTEDLVGYSKIDHQTKKFTHDYERFKNLKTFETWKSRGKTIYTLINRTGKLMGIIWFSKQTYKNIHYTFAIRTYKPVRGKGIAKMFMKYAFEDFISKNKSDVWLKMDIDNKVAGNLYIDFGFRRMSDKEGDRNIMVYKVNNS